MASKIKEIKNEKITIRCTSKEKSDLKDEASKLDMPFSSYSHALLFNEKEINKYVRRKMYVSLMDISRAANETYDYLERTDSDFVPKTEILPLIDNIRRGCDKLYGISNTNQRKRT